MALFLALVILIVLIAFMYYKETLETKIDESNSRNVELARQVRDLSFENKQLKDLRKQEVHNNTILVKENMKLQDLLKDVADRTIACPVDSEKIVLNKIKELTRNYQTK
nr:MAG TPA: cell division protein [Caudoviricetes sp.]